MGLTPVWPGHSAAQYTDKSTEETNASKTVTALLDDDFTTPKKKPSAFTTSSSGTDEARENMSTIWANQELLSSPDGTNNVQVTKDSSKKWDKTEQKPPRLQSEANTVE